jgi:hypothetical protein
MGFSDVLEMAMEAVEVAGWRLFRKPQKIWERLLVRNGKRS